MKQTLPRLLRFSLRVLSHFFGSSKGLLIAGGVAYNALLSIIPLFVVVVVAASFAYDEKKVIEVSQEYLLQMVTPKQAGELKGEIQGILAHREWLGVIGVLVLLFLSSLAFRMLEDAMALIFARAPSRRKRSFWVSAVIPYAYILVVGIALLAVTTLSTMLTGWEILGWGAPAIALYVCGLVGQLLMFTSIYMVMPTAHVQFRRALSGGLVAAVLWEITRRVLSYWFTNLSLVSKIYGGLTTVVVVLLTLEVGTVIVLLGAQVIAELEHSDEAGLAWHESPPSL